MYARVPAEAYAPSRGPRLDHIATASRCDFTRDWWTDNFQVRRLVPGSLSMEKASCETIAPRNACYGSKQFKGLVSPSRAGRTHLDSIFLKETARAYLADSPYGLISYHGRG